jgi:hypothetical protein
MDNPIYLQWQAWEIRVQEWLNQPEEDLDLPDTTSFDRVILTILTVKYQVLYRDMDKETEFAAAKKQDERKSTVKLFKTKPPYANMEERHRDKEKIFDNFTGRFLSPQQVSNETSAEWHEFGQLCEWHGLAFLQRFELCLRRFVSELISMSPAYQELIRKPAIVSPKIRIENQVYEAKNDGQVFLSVDMKSANFALLQYIHAIDAHMYPTWTDFLSLFVGSRPLLVQSKNLRLRCLGKLPEYYKLNALWTHFTTTIYQKTLCHCLDEKDVDVRCVALNGDEVVFHLDASIEKEKIIDLMEYVQRRLTKESPIVKFLVQAYRLRVFHWEKKHICFARMFIGQGDGQFDLKCVPHKDRNYERACADFRMFSGL